MKNHDFLNATEDEVQSLANTLTACVIQWCQRNRCAGSTSEYNLYARVQDAVRLKDSEPTERGG